MAFGRLGDFLDARERSLALWSEIAPRDSIAAGSGHTAGLRSDGAVVAVIAAPTSGSFVEIATDVSATVAAEAILPVVVLMTVPLK
jgi:hypothetical protein